MSKKISIFSFLTVFLFLMVSFSLVSGGGGCDPGNVRGYAWSDNIGWISFSCFNTYDSGEGVDYGVYFNSITESLSGYAWSDNVGWISFESDDLEGCPDGDCEAVIDGSGDVSGWAKVLSNGEWISLSDIELEGNRFTGYGWGDRTIGWASFDCENEDECQESDYNVFLVLPPDPPSDVDVEFREDNQCVGEHSVPTIVWEYSDPLGADAEGYKIETAYGSIEESIFLEDGDVTETTISPNDWDGSQEWGTTFDCTIQVKNEHGLYSDVNECTFSNLARPYPQPELSWSPETIHFEEMIEFTGKDDVQEEGVSMTDELRRTFEFDFGEHANPEEESVEDTVEKEVVVETYFDVEAVGDEKISLLRITYENPNDVNHPGLSYSCKIEENLGEIRHPFPEYFEN